jgi:diguanylate cyclase (GGDEF)-like protein
MVSETTYSKAEYPSPSAAVLSALTRNQHGAEHSGINLRGWLEEAAALIEHHGLEIMGWNRKMSAILAHLKQAYVTLSLAEEKISSLQDRISVLEDLTTTDDLTGLKNRRGFREGFERELQVCKRLNLPGGLLVMIDLDNFKAVNDTYGHQAGDAALKLVARTLAQEVRKTDIAARLGGDEFVLLLSNTTKTKAVTRAQTISWQLNNLSLAWFGEIISLQASIGVKEFSSGDNIEDIIQSADSTMYANKSERKQAMTI